MKTLLCSLAVALALPVAAEASSVAVGDVVTFGLVSSTDGLVYSEDFTVGSAVDYRVGAHTVDMNVGLTNEMLITVDPANYCGLYSCGGDTTEFVFSGITFDDGSVLTGFNATADAGLYLGYEVLGPDSIGFWFNDTAFSNADGLFLEGTFVTDAAPVPLPAAGGLLLAGLGALGAMRRRKR